MKNKKLLLCALMYVPFVLGCAGGLDNGSSGGNGKKYVVSDTNWVEVVKYGTDGSGRVSYINVRCGGVRYEYSAYEYEKLEYRCIDYSTLYTEVFVKMAEKVGNNTYIIVDKFLGTNVCVEHFSYEYGTITEE